jgi:hypothetical protein
MGDFFDRVTNLIYLFASVSLLLISLLLIGYGLWEVAVALYERHEIVSASLDAIGLIVISMAVFDISKYLYEEEITRNRELRSPGEARRTLTKFLVIVTIAVTLEALVFIFETGTTDMRMLIYPTALLVASVFLVLGLGWYQRLSWETESGSDARPVKPD